MALVGFEQERARIDEQIAQIRKQLGGRPEAAAQGASAERKPRRGRPPLSAAARKRISAAQKRRWAEHRKKAQGGKAE